MPISSPHKSARVHPSLVECVQFVVARIDLTGLGFKIQQASFCGGNLHRHIICPVDMNRKTKPFDRKPPRSDWIRQRVWYSTQKRRQFRGSVVSFRRVGVYASTSFIVQVAPRKSNLVAVKFQCPGEKPASQINLPDLHALLGLVHEGKTIEYKREMPARKNDEIVKFLAPVLSLASTAGGDLLIGVDTKSGLAYSISGVAFADLAAEKLRPEQLLANSIEPRLPRVEIEAVDCAEGRHVLVIRSHRSWIGPYMVTVNDKFYGRNSADKYPLDVTELRSTFVLGESVAERIRNFRRDRLIKVSAGETPTTVTPGRDGNRQSPLSPHGPACSRMTCVPENNFGEMAP